MKYVVNIAPKESFKSVKIMNISQILLKFEGYIAIFEA